MVKQLNQMIFKFLWKGTDKVTRVSTINEYLEGGLNMIDLECMVKSLRLAWNMGEISGTQITTLRWFVLHEL